MEDDRLNERQRRFAQEYLIDSNARQAAIRAGYSAKTAHVHGPRLLSNVRVAAAVARGQAAISDRLGATAERVTEEIARLAFSDIGDILDFDGDQLRMRPPSKISADARRAIQSIKVRQVNAMDSDGLPVPCEIIEFKLHHKTVALQQLIDKLGLKAPTGSYNMDVPDEYLDELTQEELAQVGSGKWGPLQIAAVVAGRRKGAASN